MKIPEKFEIGGQEIKVIIEDQDSENRYGYYDDVTEEIHLFKKLKIDGKVTELTSIQIENSFFHELFHCFQFHGKGDTSESESSTYAAFMTQFLKSSNLSIV